MKPTERPIAHRKPKLDPLYDRLSPRRLAKGVYALTSRGLRGYNGGCIIGSEGALVIDAGINGHVARHIQNIVRTLTPRPILYLVNTNHHGDRSFGNYAFPPSTNIIASRPTSENMTDLAAEKELCWRDLYGASGLLDDVVEWRLPNATFEDHMALDLGGRMVELWHFGPGVTPGDTIVYSRESGVAWTGSLAGIEHLVPILSDAGPIPYLEMLGRFEHTLKVKTIVPGHGPLGAAKVFGQLKEYLWELLQDVHLAYELGLTSEAALTALPLKRKYRLPWWRPMAHLNNWLEDLHRMNVLTTYRLREQEAGRGAPSEREVPAAQAAEPSEQIRVVKAG
jgi:cyclase